VSKNAKNNVAIDAVANNEDIQADEHNTISVAAVRQLVDELFSWDDPDKPLYGCGMIQVLNFMASFFSSLQVCRHGEENYKQVLTQRYTRDVDEIGPTGTTCLFVVSRKSKNTLGDKKSRTCHAPHLDPLRDSSFYHGLLWLYRFMIMDELGDGKFPDFSDYATASLIPTYRKEHDSRPLGRDQYGKLFARIFAAAPYVDVPKKTHQGKVQGILEMKDAGIPTDDISRFVGQQATSTVETEALANNYLTSPPVNCVVQRAGGRPMRSRDHWPAYTTVEVPDDLLRHDPRLGALLDQRDRIHADHGKHYTRKARKERQLYSAKGTVDAVIYEIKRVFQVLAARPVDPKTYCINKTLS
jgi:hypothetical protein